MIRLRQALVAHEVFQRTEYQGERRTQFVGDVGEEAQPFLVQVLFLQTLPTFQFERIFQSEFVLVVADEMPDDATSQ